MSLEAIDSALSAIKNTEEVELKRFSSDFVNKITGNISRCLDDGNKPFSIRSGENYNINFNEPAYVEDIEIFFVTSIFGAPIDVSVFDSLSNRDYSYRMTLESYKESIVFSPKKVCTGFAIHLHSNLFDLIKRKSLDIKRIKVSGYFVSDFEDITRALQNVNTHKTEALSTIQLEKEEINKKTTQLNQKEKILKDLEETKKEELEDLQDSIAEHEKSAEEWQNHLKQINKDISAADARKNQLNDQISINETTIRNIEGEITSGKVQLDILARRTKEADEKLKELTKNVNLFSEEFASFSDHGAKQTKTYIWLSLIPILVILILVWQLLFGAVDLSVKYSENPDIDLLTIFVTRIPYILVCGSILTVCYSLVIFLFKRISFIYAEKLDFSKIGIIAKDVATASSNNTSLPDEHLYEARTYLKIEMLKSYLGGNIGSYTYNNRLVGNQNVNKDNIQKDKSGIEKITDPSIIKEEGKQNE
ncbi:hypothetical protein [Comamonas aquatica]|uniref:hypothetical protein n=1 Tax=Comamonas aquatica TaxID=225991 RepID=UPI0004BB9B9E|nr:hypothetical protein [Comamonas aquatica]